MFKIKISSFKAKKNKSQSKKNNKRKWRRRKWKFKKNKNKIGWYIQRIKKEIRKFKNRKSVINNKIIKLEKEW